MFQVSMSTAICMWVCAVVSIIVLSFRIRDWKDAKENVNEFFLVIDTDAEYRILACCEYFEDALKLAQGYYYDKGIQADVIPVNLNIIYD